MIRLSHAGPRPGLNLTSVEAIYPVGTSVPQDTMTKLKTILPNLKWLLSAYGSTETAGVISMAAEDDNPTNIGPPFANNMVGRLF